MPHTIDLALAFLALAVRKRSLEAFWRQYRSIMLRSMSPGRSETHIGNLPISPCPSSLQIDKLQMIKGSTSFLLALLILIPNEIDMVSPLFLHCGDDLWPSRYYRLHCHRPHYLSPPSTDSHQHVHCPSHCFSFQCSLIRHCPC